MVNAIVQLQHYFQYFLGMITLVYVPFSFVPFRVLCPIVSTDAIYSLRLISSVFVSSRSVFFFAASRPPKLVLSCGVDHQA